MKTFDQCKDEVAKKYGYEGWPDMMLQLTTKTVELGGIRRKTNEAAELYAQEVAKDAWDRACEAQRKRTYEVLSLSSKSFLYPRDYDKLVEWMERGAKPEYQPNQEKP